MFIKNNEKRKSDYSQAQPYTKRIQKINTLYEEGHTIVYWIARGTLTNKR